MRLAYFSPLNPQKSGISDYSEELLPTLAEGAEIDLFVDGFTPTNEAIVATFRVFDYRKDPSCLRRLGNYDAIVCQMGNRNEFHSGIYEVARRNPAIVVFHDFALQHFFLERARQLKDPTSYLVELEASAGRESRLGAEEALSRGVAPPQYQNPGAFPMNFGLANSSEGIIVHSEWSRSRLVTIAPGVPVAKIEMHVKFSESDSSGSGSSSNHQLSIASFGFITASKGLECALRALAALKSDHSFEYRLVGENDSYFDINELARSYGLGDRVSVTGYVSLEAFKSIIAETDIAINLRDQTVGETSASLCRLMAAGVPTLVSNLGWFSELPDDCVVKIDGVPETDLLVCAYLKELMDNEQLRKRIGANARNLIAAHHRVEQTAAAYLDFIHQVIANRARRRFLDGISGDIARLSDNQPDELLLSSVVSEISRLL